ncbi:hypothetical protein [Rickettsia asembonensis]|nr:hypothetical protein [Rickettsia asembonensis]
MSFLRKQESSINRAFNFKNFLYVYFFSGFPLLAKNDIKTI